MLACNRGFPLEKDFHTKSAPIKAGGEVKVWYNAPPCPDNWVLPDEIPMPETGDGGPTWCIWDK